LSSPVLETDLSFAVDTEAQFYGTVNLTTVRISNIAPKNKQVTNERRSISNEVDGKVVHNCRYCVLDTDSGSRPDQPDR
jgi:hypothetical protein